jgi:putative ABC transport system permease protein
MLSLLRHGLVSLRRSPTLAVTITVTLGIALAATVIVFSFLNSFLLRPLPYGDAARIVVLYEHSVKTGRQNLSRVTYGNFGDVQEQATSFSRLGLFRNESVTVHSGDTTEVAFVQRVTADVFPMMGVKPALGEVISPANLERDGTRAVLLADALWRRRFGADAGIVGRMVRLDDQNFRVVGVLPADFRVPTGDDNPQAWIGLLPTEIVRNERVQRRHHLWAELAPGRTIGAANAELAAIAARSRNDFPATNADRGLVAVTLRDDLLGAFGRNLLLLQGAVLLVLAVACFNCLCLLIARAIQRRREFAVRLALGAARRHLLAQLFAESLWLAAPAAVLALVVAQLALPFGVALLPTGATVNALAAPHVDPVVAAGVGLAALLVALTFSAVPLLQTRKMNLESTLREGGRSAGSAAGTKAARWLATAQVAVALALLISAALLVRSQQQLRNLNPGFPVAEFDMFRVGLRGAAYANDPERRLAFFDRVMENVRALPGVREVALASFIAPTLGTGMAGFVQEGDGLQISDTPKRGVQRPVSPNFFSVFGLRVLAGRALDDRDVAGRPPVVVINAALAARYWPNESPIGRRVQLEGRRPGEWFEIVGVVSDTLGFGNQPSTVDGFYATLSQWNPPGLGMGFFVRHQGVAPDERALQRAVWSLDPDMGFFQHQSVAAQYAESAWQARFVTQLVVAFAVVAVLLSLAGIYAVNSFFVARRVNEFGIRAALGASGANLIGLVLGDALRVTAFGLVAGGLLAFAASRGLAGLLYAVPGVDLGVYAGSALVMTIAAGAAALLPARRASRVDPLTALRAE